jgi:ABC-type Mn2+/Zn2+ transport system permease subunit
VVGAISINYAHLILQTNPDIADTAVQAWLKARTTLLRYVWYMLFAVFDCIAILCITKIHKRYEIRGGTLARIIVLGFFVDGLMNLARLAERFAVNSNYLVGAYRWLVPSVSVGTMIVVFMIASMVLVKSYKPSGAGKNT